MNRLKGLAFVLGLSLISAVSLRLLLQRATDAMAPPTQAPAPEVTAAEVERRFVGCGGFRFAFDSLGYSSRQWPGEVVGEGPLRNAPAVFVARSDTLFAASADAASAEGRGTPVGTYRLGAGSVDVVLGADTALRARLLPQGDSLAGELAMRRPEAEGALRPVGRVFLETPDPRPAGCDG